MLVIIYRCAWTMGVLSTGSDTGREGIHPNLLPLTWRLFMIAVTHPHEKWSMNNSRMSSLIMHLGKPSCVMGIRSKSMVSEWMDKRGPDNTSVQNVLVATPVRGNSAYYMLNLDIGVFYAGKKRYTRALHLKMLGSLWVFCIYMLIILGKGFRVNVSYS